MSASAVRTSGISECLRGFVGIPFLDGGRDRSGCDCWGLVRLVYAASGIELPTYGEIGATEMLRVARAVRSATGASGVWRRVDREPRRALDVATMVRFGDAPDAAWHVGVLVSSDRLLHTEAGMDSHTVSIGHHSVAARIVGFWRHADLAPDSAPEFA